MIPFLNRRSIGALLAAAALAVTASQAHAAFTLTLAQSGANVTLTGVGTLNTTALTPSAVGGALNLYAPGDIAIAGFSNNSNQTQYAGITGPAAFGPGTATLLADSTTGFTAGLSSRTSLLLGSGYVSGTAITNSATFNNTTIAATGATPGTYTFTWGTGLNADSLTLVVAGVPEPSTWAMMGVGVAGLGLVLRRRTVRA